MTSNGMPINKIVTKDIIKLILATIVFVLWFLIKEWKVWETEDSLYFQDYLSKQTIKDSIIEQIHQSAPDTTDLCTSNDTLCKKIKIDNNIEVIPYKNQIYTWWYFINSNQIFDKKIVDAIQKIDIKNDDQDQKRWYATRDTIILNITPTNWVKEFLNLSIHELWHVFDLWVIQWSSNTKSKLYTEFSRSVFAINDPSLSYYKISWESEKIRKSTSTKKDFCSWYGMTDPFEDFAECFNLFINSQSFFKVIAKKNKNLEKKYNFIASVIKWNYINKNAASIVLIKDNSDRRPRDTTKL